MTPDQMLTLLAMLTDTITALSAQIDSLTAQVQALQEGADDGSGVPLADG